MLNWKKILCRHSNILTVTMGGAVRLYISTVVVYEVVSFFACTFSNKRKKRVEENGLHGGKSEIWFPQIFTVYYPREDTENH